MHILLLTHGIPYPPDRGPRVKAYQLLQHLAARHQVTLVCLGRDGAESTRAAALRGLCAAVHIVPGAPSVWGDLRAALASLLGGRPTSVARYANGALHELLAQLLAEAAAAGRPFDLVHADQLVMAQFAERLPLPRLLDAHNAVWTIQAQLARQQPWPLRWLYQHEAARLRAYEGEICAGFEAVVAVSEADRAALGEAAGGRGTLAVIPIGVDGVSLAPPPQAGAAHDLLSLAAPDWPPNAEGLAWFGHEVFPLVRRADPTARLVICGANPAPELRALAEADPAVEVTGFVLPGPYLERARAVIAPLRSSGGMRVLLLEALARGLPVVATSVACAGLEVVSGEHLLVADTPSDFADAAALLLRDPELGARLGAAGRRLVLARYDWRALYSAIERVYGRMTAPATAPADDGAAGAPAPT